MKLKKRNERKRRFRPSFADWLILLLAVAVIAVGAWYVLRRRDAASPTVTVRYTLCLYDTDATLVEDGAWKALIPVGSSVTNAAGTASLGKVSAVSVRPHSVAAVREGEVVFVELPARVDLLVTVRATATAQTGDGLRVHDIRVSAGERGDWRVGGLLASGAEILAVAREEKQ